MSISDDTSLNLVNALATLVVISLTTSPCLSTDNNTEVEVKAKTTYGF